MDGNQIRSWGDKMAVVLGRFLWRVGSGIWLGTILFFSLVVTPAIFLELPLSEASHLLLRIFPAYYGVGLWSGGLALVGSVLHGWYASGRRAWLLFIESLLAWILVVYVERLLSIMKRLSTTSSRFAHLHGESVMINTVIGVILLAGFILESWLLNPYPGWGDAKKPPV
ncbi:MAG TPA: hypothetical protein DD856_03460 [Sulfobacillus sp.]|nr:hypothetical protein [Sulfobacillus sp.]